MLKKIMISVKFFLLISINIILIPIYLFFYFICLILSFIPIFPSETASKNIKNHLQIVGFRNKICVSFVLMHYVFYIFEALIFDMISITHCSLDRGFELKKFLQSLKNKYPTPSRKGFVILLSHMANVEMYSLETAKCFKELQYNSMYGLAQEPKSRILKNLLFWYRTRPGLDTLWTDKSLFENMSLKIEQGHSFCLLVDQKPRKKSLFIKFFGHEAAFPTGGLKFCMDAHMIVFYASAKRIFPGWIRLRVHEGLNSHLKASKPDILLDQPTEDLNTTVESEMHLFVPWLEEEIKKNPWQWCWDYNKWSRKPEILDPNRKEFQHQ